MDKHLLLLPLAVLTLCLISVSESADADSFNICAFSKDPSKYGPKCYGCAKVVYPNALMACINATEMPKNITYNQASCMEKNCEIDYPVPTPADVITDQFDPVAILQRLALLVQGKKKRSVEDNALDQPGAADSHAGQVVKEISVLVVDGGTPELGDIEYL